jgi:hypothetical protein
MNRILNHLIRLVAWLNERDGDAEPTLSAADWADLPPYHAPAPRS